MDQEKIASLLETLEDLDFVQDGIASFSFMMQDIPETSTLYKILDTCYFSLEKDDKNALDTASLENLKNEFKLDIKEKEKEREKETEIVIPTFSRN